MSTDETQIQNAVADVLEISAEQLEPTTALESVANFDSITVLSLIVALDDIGITVSQADAMNLTTYQDILDLRT
jgi:acyl carrier protein